MIDPTYGVREDEKELYQKEMFSCKDGSKRIPRSMVNDDFCDCKDGSDEPGTSACTNGLFYCANAGHIGISIVSARVNDGICDCCDGSDEYNSGIQCENTCSAMHAQWVEMNGAREEKYAKGTEILHKWMEEALEAEKSRKELNEVIQNEITTLAEEIQQEKSVLAELQKDIPEEIRESLNEYESEEMKNAYRELGIDALSENELRYLIVSILSRSTDGDNAALSALREDIQKLNPMIEVNVDMSLDVLGEKLNRKQDDGEKAEIREQREKITSLENLLQDKQNEKNRNSDDKAYYGKSLEFYKMKNDCISKQINKYTYQICPFGTSKQDMVSLGSKFSILNDKNEAITDEMIVHVRNDGVMENGDVFFKWEDGQPCWNGPKRSLKLRLVCSDTIELISLSEPSMCLYEGELSTPAVCPL